MKRIHGFSLLELLIAIAIIGIATAFAIPSYQAYTQRATRAAAQADLVAAAGALERFKAQTFTYSGATYGNTAAFTITDRSPIGVADADRKYIFTLTTPTTTKFVITALSTSRFSSSGVEAMTIDEAGNRCLRPLAVGVTTCDFTGSSDTRW